MKKIYIYIICSLMAVGSLSAQEGLGTYLRSIIQNQEKGLLVAARLIEACGLCDTLDLQEDETYKLYYEIGKFPSNINANEFAINKAYTPQQRRYGYTLFAETDDFWIKEGIDPMSPELLQHVTQWIVNNGLYTVNDVLKADEEYQNEEHILYQWVTYHLLPMRILQDELVHHINEYGYNLSEPDKLTIPVTEYYVTMGKRRLLRTYESAKSGGVYINRFPQEDRKRGGTGYEIDCTAENEGIYIDKTKAIQCTSSAMIYPIDKVLAFTDQVADKMGKIRLRFDVANLFPELINSGIRLKKSSNEQDMNVYIPSGNVYPYLADININSDCRMLYQTGWKLGWQNLFGDEFRIGGRFDFTLRLPPVPRSGEYEIRFKSLCTGTNALVQVYIGTDPENLAPAGMPIDFRKGFRNETKYGWKKDSGNDYNDQHVDNELHHNRVMKGAKSIGGWTDERSDMNSMRFILVKQGMNPNETYYIRFRNLLDTSHNSFYLDYFEFCPKEVYDNPIEPEDIW